ncbi:glycoside hydrolase family 105 protein [Pedobacter sp. JCM 36344]|uniref:glycoside hydrolase family 88/105 protein n=1 Tax=Pedobacter sp. JCM 36344 TaxID=3374280 RepID=UPI00397B9BD9
MIRFLIICITALYSNVATAQSSILARESILKNMKKVGAWQINEFKEGKVKIPKTNWENGALYAGMMALKSVDNDKVYYDFLYGIGESNRWDMGRNRLFADDYCVAQLYTQLYLEYKDPKMINKWVALADTIVAHQFNEPLKVVPNINLREWAWCDALFMGPPSLAYLSTAKKDLKYLKKADTLWWKTSAYLYDKKAHLYYRDSRFFDRRENNGANVFWSRGNGWVMGGLVRMMNNMPKNFPNRKKFESQFVEMAEKVASLQQEDGSWHASLLDPASYSEKETSGTGFFCYAMTWGIRKGLLPKKKYLPIIEKAWMALSTSVHPNGKLGYVQKVGDQPGAAGYDSTNVYGVGAFLLAGSELYQLNKK